MNMGFGCGHAISTAPQPGSGGAIGSQNGSGNQGGNGGAATNAASGASKGPRFYDWVSCPTDIAVPVIDEVRKRLSDQDACYNGTVIGYPSNYWGVKTIVNYKEDPKGSNPWYLSPDYADRMGAIVDCTPGGSPLENSVFSALRDLPAPSDCTVEVQIPGAALDQMDRVEDSLRNTDCQLECGGPHASIVLDANGAVVDVVAIGSSTNKTTAVDCMRRALSGLTFPCLGSSTLCYMDCALE